MRFTQEECVRAVSTVMVGIKRAIEAGDLDGVYIVFMYVGSPDMILYEEGAGDPEEWEGDFLNHGREKARLSAIHGMSTRRLKKEKPHAFDEARVKHLHEGAIVQGGLVISFCGAGRGNAAMAYQVYDVMLAERTRLAESLVA